MSEHDHSASIERAAVLGAGTMGHGIAHVLCGSGIETRLFDISDAAVETGKSKITANLEKGVQRGKVTAEEREAALGRLSGTTDMGAAVDGVQLSLIHI